MSIVYNCQDVKATYVSISSQMDKKVVTFTHTHTDILLSHKKGMKLFPFSVTRMDSKFIMLSEIIQRQILYDITYMCNPKKFKKPRNKTKEADSQI